jgi:hypothetical protein
MVRGCGELVLRKKRPGRKGICPVRWACSFEGRHQAEIVLQILILTKLLNGPSEVGSGPFHELAGLGGDLFATNMHAAGVGILWKATRVRSAAIQHNEALKNEKEIQRRSCIGSVIRQFCIYSLLRVPNVVRYAYARAIEL